MLVEVKQHAPATAAVLQPGVPARMQCWHRALLRALLCDRLEQLLGDCWHAALERSRPEHVCWVKTAWHLDLLPGLAWKEMTAVNRQRSYWNTLGMLWQTALKQEVQSSFASDRFWMAQDATLEVMQV